MTVFRQNDNTIRINGQPTENLTTLSLPVNKVCPTGRTSKRMFISLKFTGCAVYKYINVRDSRPHILNKTLDLLLLVLSL